MEERHMKVIRIYLSGSIKKGEKDKEQFFWTEEEENFIKDNVKGYTVELLNPAKANIKRSDPFANFGCDLNLVKNSHFLIADLRERRGIGIGCEMTMAKFYKIPVISICPRESHYRRSRLQVYGENLCDWVHPMVVGLSDAIVENLPEAVSWINDFLASPKIIRSIEVVEEAINHYKRTQLVKDEG